MSAVNLASIRASISRAVALGVVLLLVSAGTSRADFQSQEKAVEPNQPVEQPPEKPAEPLAEKPAEATGVVGPEATPDEDLPEKVAGPRDLLKVYGIDQSHFQRLTDGQAWQEGEDELLLRILYRLRDFSPKDIEAWARPLTGASELAAEPETHRGEFYRVRGRVTRVTLCRPLPEVVERFELTQYYRVEFLIGDQRQPAVIFTHTVPRAWKPDQPLEELAGALGMFLKLAGTDANQPRPVFVAPRVAWYPATELGELGMDYGLFDDLAPEGTMEDQASQAKPKSRRDLGTLRLTSRSRECFYQMLAAAGRSKPGELLAKANAALKQSGQKTSPVVPLFNEPQKQQGRLVVLSGTIRQAIPVRVGEDDVLARFGIDQYYQMFLFTDGSQGNPLVFCVRKLPKGMPTGEDPSYAEHVTVAGFFFNTWAYRSRDTGDSSGQVRWQLAPLLVGQEPIWHPRPTKPSNVWAGVVFGVLFAVVVIGIWLSLWLSQRSDRQFREKVLGKATDLEVTLALDELAKDADSKNRSPSDDKGQ